MSETVTLGYVPVPDGRQQEIVERLQKEGLEFTVAQAEQMLEMVRAGKFEQAQFAISWRVSDGLVAELQNMARRSLSMVNLVEDGLARVSEQDREKLKDLARALGRASGALTMVLNTPTADDA